MSREFRSVFKPLFEKFILYKNNSGCKYHTGSDVLHMFDKHCLEKNISKIKLTRELVESFLILKEKEKVTNQANKGVVIRQFGKYLIIVHNMIDSYIVPMIKCSNEIYIPYIYSYEEIKRFLLNAKNYTSHTPNILSNIRNVISIIFPILYSTGMRISEVLNIKVKDVDLNKGAFTILEAKNENQRIVPISESLKHLCINYYNESILLDKDDYYINSGKQKCKINRSLIYYFRQILMKTGIRHKGRGFGPRIHDFRHTFAVHSLTKLSNTNEDINASLAYLSKYLGHSYIYETQKYIWLTPDLFKNVLYKMDSYTSFISNIFEEERYEEE